MHNYLKRATSAAIAGAVVLGTLALYPNTDNINGTVNADTTRFDSASAINYATILGGAVDYGVVANEIVQTSHTESTFATNSFVHVKDNIDVDYITSTALFLVGSYTPGAADNRYIRFGTTTASALYFEAPEVVYGDDFDPSKEPMGPNGNFRFEWKDSVPFIAAENENASVNVNRLINRICSTEKVEDAEIGWAYFLQNRANDAAYVLNPKGKAAIPNSPYFTDMNSYVKVDLTDPSFDGKVVYINVDADSQLLNYLQKSGGFRIYKNESSVVVINIEDNAFNGGTLNMKQPRVITNGVEYVGQTDSFGKDPKAADQQRYYNETVIWNIMESSNIELEDFGGAVLAPATKKVTLSDGNSSGWVVTSGTFEMAKEFHFLYSGSSKDSYGDMHFALTKAFTDTYAEHGSVVQDTSITIPDDNTYRFFIQEYERENGYRGEFQRAYGKKQEVWAKSIGTVTFPILSFTCNDSNAHYNVPKGTEKMFFFTITEDTTNAPKGIENSNGHINIRLKVKVDENGKFTYFVDYQSVTGDGVIFREYGEVYGNEIKMSGVQFDLGAFYNKVKQNSVDISKRDVNQPNGDEVKGAKLTVTYVGNNPEIDMTKVKLFRDGKDVTSEGELATGYVSFVSSEEGPVTIYGIKPGDYTLTETIAPEGFKPSSSVIEFTVGADGKVTETTPIVNPNDGFIDDDTVVILDEMYKADLDISKRDSAGNEIAGAVLTLTSNDKNVDLAKLGVTATQGNDTAKDLKVEGNSVSFETLADSDTKIKGLPDGTYTLTETTTPFGYETAESQTITIEKGIVTSGTPAVMIDKLYQTDVTIRKADTAGDEVVGAQLTITASDTTVDLAKLGVTATQGTATAQDLSVSGNKISFTTVSGNDTVVKGLPDGEYTLTETLTPGGYMTAESKTITIEKGVVKNPGNPVVMIDAFKTDVSIRKEDSAGKEVPGATLTLTADKTSVDFSALGVTATQNGQTAKDLVVSGNSISFTTVSGCNTDIKGLPDGTYTLTETIVPEGFFPAESQKITIENGKVTGANPVVMVDAFKTDVTIKKQDSAGNEVVGAKLSITAQDTSVDFTKLGVTATQGTASAKDLSVSGNTISFTTVSGNDTIVKGLPDGTYTLTEEITPDGYSTAESQTITIVNGKVTGANPVVMVDGLLTDVEIRKEDSAGNEVEGATLTLTAADRTVDFAKIGVTATQNGSEAKNLAISGNKLSFETVDSGNTIIKGIPDGTYTLTETTTPNGYLTAESQTITVVNGKVTGANPVVMVDAIDSEVVISKKDSAGNEVVGAKLSITADDRSVDLGKFGVTATQGTAAAKDLSVSGNTISFTTVSGNDTVVKGLPDGTYTLTETTTPNGYFKAESQTITIKEGKVTNPSNPVIMIDDHKTDIEIQKRDSAGKEVVGATLALTANDTTVDFGKLGVTASQNGRPASGLNVSGNKISFTTVSGSDTMIKGLPDGTYTLTETNVPGGYEQAEQQTITIENGVVTSKTPIIMIDANVIVTDTPTPTLTDTPTPTVTDTPTPTVTDTPTPTVTDTPTPTVTDTPTPTVTDTPTPTVTDTPTPTVTDTPTPTVTDTPTPTVTDTPTPTVTDTPTPTVTDTPTPTVTDTPTPTVTDTPTPTVTDTPTPTVTDTPTPTVTDTPTPTVTDTPTPTVTDTPTPTVTDTPTPTVTDTPTPTVTDTPTPTVTDTPTPTVTDTPTPTVTDTPTPTVTDTPTPTVTDTPTPTVTDTPTPTVTDTPTPTVTDTPTPPITDTPTPTPPPADLKIKISKQDVAGKEIAKAELTLTSLDGYDMSGVTLIQGNKTIYPKVSADKMSISYETVDTSQSEVIGLRAGRYRLTETVTPKQYLTADAIEFELKDDGSFECRGKIYIAGSPIVMVDKADPTYKGENDSSEHKPLPATGEELGITTIIGVIIIGFAVALLTGFGVYRFKRRRI